MTTVGVDYRDLHVQYLFESYRTRYQDAFDEVFPNAVPMDFVSHNVDVRYDVHIGDRVTITPRFIYRYQRPWSTSLQPPRDFDMLSPAEQDDFRALRDLAGFDEAIHRTVGSLNGSFQIIDQLSANLGFEARWDRAVLRDYQPALDDLGDAQLFSPDDLSADFRNFAAFAELQSENRILNATAGIRVAHHSVYGTSVVPRLAIGRVIGDFHFKVLYANAFKAAGVENINQFLDPMGTATSIRPERTRIFELELGYRAGDHVFVTANAFDIRLAHPIVYFFDDTLDVEGYRNFDSTGSRGLESQLSVRYPWGYVNAGYSYYAAAYNHVDLYQVPQNGRALLAAPQHKGTVQASVQLYRGLMLTGTLIATSRRYAQALDPSGTVGVEALPARVLANAYLRYQDLFTEGLSIGFGVFNLGGTSYPYVQPYLGGHANLPGQQREYVFRVTYDRTL
jgi:outer membrane receptor for ferrienterochelin and colicin